MSEVVYRRAGDIRPGGIVCVADHASNRVPAEVEKVVSEKEDK